MVGLRATTATMSPTPCGGSLRSSEFRMRTAGGQSSGRRNENRKVSLSSTSSTRAAHKPGDFVAIEVAVLEVDQHAPPAQPKHADADGAREVEQLRDDVPAMVGRDDRPTAGSEHACELGKTAFGIEQMLDHLRAENDVEAVVGERQRLQVVGIASNSIPAAEAAARATSRIRSEMSVAATRFGRAGSSVSAAR